MLYLKHLRETNKLGNNRWESATDESSVIGRSRGCCRGPELCGKEEAKREKPPSQGSVLSQQRALRGLRERLP